MSEARWEVLLGNGTVITETMIEENGARLWIFGPDQWRRLYLGPYR